MVSEKQAAKNEIVDSVRDLLSLKVTLPLGNPDLKLVHTNQFCQTELPDEFMLENFGVIAKALNSAYNRNVGYTTNKWYIEGRTITNDMTKFTMDLELNPFASTLLDYRENKDNYEKSYTDALEQQNNTTSNSGGVPSVTSTGGCKGGEGKVIDDLAKKIVGNETSPLKKAKLIHNWLIKNVSYKYYACTRYNTAEKCYNNRGHLNCADTARLTRALMSSAGLDAQVVHYYHPNNGHFWCVVKINGKEYASDATSHSRKFNQVYKNQKYNKKNGKNPDC